MTHQAAVALGQSLRVLAAAPDDGAALVAADTVIGDHTDLDALLSFAKGCDVVTFDHEHVPGEHIRALVAQGFVVHPSADALRHAQNKRLMRERLGHFGRSHPGLAAGRRPGRYRGIPHRTSRRTRGEGDHRRLRRARRVGARYSRTGPAATR
jgi:hypothetical protein